MTKLVISLLLFSIAENFIGLGGFFELFLRNFCLVAGVKVGVLFLCKFSICFFYLISRGTLINTKHLIIISFFCQNMSPTFSICNTNGRALMPSRYITHCRPQLYSLRQRHYRLPHSLLPGPGLPAEPEPHQHRVLMKRHRISLKQLLSES